MTQKNRTSFMNDPLSQFLDKHTLGQQVPHVAILINKELDIISQFLNSNLSFLAVDIANENMDALKAIEKANKARPCASPY